MKRYSVLFLGKEMHTETMLYNTLSMIETVADLSGGSHSHTYNFM